MSSVSHYLFNGSVWHTYLLPGLDKSLGWGWSLLLALVGAGTVAGLLIGPTQAHRLMAWVAGASVVGYLFTQQILGPQGHPVYFGVNVRYVAPGLVLGLVALPSAAVRWPRLRGPILGLYLLMLAVLQLDPTLWPSDFLHLSFVPPIRGTDSLLGALIGVLVLIVGLAVVLWGTWQNQVRARPWRICGVIAAVLVIGGAVLTPYYQRHRYESNTLYPWANDLHHQRIGVYGPFSFLQYPAAGLDLSNHVQFLGLEDRTGRSGPFPTAPRGDGSSTPVTTARSSSPAFRPSHRRRGIGPVTTPTCPRESFPRVTWASASSSTAGSTRPPARSRTPAPERRTGATTATTCGRRRRPGHPATHRSTDRGRRRR